MLTNRAFELLAPKPIQLPSEWAEENIYLPAEITNHAGKFNCDLNPYIKAPLDSIADINTKRLVLMFATQAGKTTIQSILSIWLAIHRSQPQLWVFPSSSMATAFSKERLQKIMRNCDALKSYFPENEKDHFTNLSMMFKCCTISLTGSFAENAVSSRPVGNLFIDEQDCIKNEHANSAGSVSLALERVKSFGENSLVVMASSPTVESQSGELIADNFKDTNQNHFHVCCLKCEHLAPIDFSNEEKFHVVWEREKDSQGITDINKACNSARLKCPKCGELFTDSEKHQMMLHPKSKWIEANPKGREGWIGFHASSLMSTWVKMADGVRQFYQAKNSVNQLRAFTNGFLAQTFYHTTSDEVDAVDLSNLESEFEKGQMIPNAQHIVLCDVQKYSFPTIVLARDEAGCFFVVDWQVASGFNDIAAIQERYEAEFVLMDCRFNTGTILEECFNRNWIPARAFKTMTGFYDMQPVNPDVGKKEKYGKRIFEFRWNKQNFTREWFSHRSGATGNFFLYRYSEFELKKELCSEVEVELQDKRTGKTKWEFRKTYAHEHASDNVCLGIAFFNFLKAEQYVPKSKKPVDKKPSIEMKNQNIVSGIGL
jgi:hypothetical protein